MVNKKGFFQDKKAICESETYDFYGKTLTQSGNYQYPLLTSKGCDSTINLTLMVNKKGFFQDKKAICESETYDFYGKMLTQSGNYQYPLLTSKGCDSTINLTLTVNKKGFFQDKKEICEGESYTFLGQKITQSGTYQKVLKTKQGCDSLINLTLTVLPTPQLILPNHPQVVAAQSVALQLEIKTDSILHTSIQFHNTN
jgi:hypothetical protein